MGWKKTLISSGKFVASQFAPDALNLVAKISNEFIEKQKNLVKIPDLRDVNIQEALRLLKDDLNDVFTYKPSLIWTNEGWRGSSGTTRIIKSFEPRGLALKKDALFNNKLLVSPVNKEDSVLRKELSIFISAKLFKDCSFISDIFTP